MSVALTSPISVVLLKNERPVFEDISVETPQNFQSQRFLKLGCVEGAEVFGMFTCCGEADVSVYRALLWTSSAPWRTPRACAT